MKNLYNEDGSLSAQAKQLINEDISRSSKADRRKRIKEFKSFLSFEEIKEFEKLIRKGIHKKWRINNPQKTQRFRKNWSTANPQKATKATLNYRNKRLQSDHTYRFLTNLRSQCRRVVKCLSLSKKPVSTFKWVGCTPEELKVHFESLFAVGMSWDNYGEWHVDHIRPVSSFKPEEWEQVNHYTNLQPLWAEDNLKKGDKY